MCRRWKRRWSTPATIPIRLSFAFNLSATKELMAPSREQVDRWTQSNRSLALKSICRTRAAILRPGMYANVDILLDKRDNVLTLPTTAIVRDGGMTYCCCIEAGKIDRRKIELGLRSGGEVEVRSGLDADQVVVLARADSLKPGQAVEIIAPPK